MVYLAAVVLVQQAPDGCGAEPLSEGGVVKQTGARPVAQLMAQPGTGGQTKALFAARCDGGWQLVGEGSLEEPLRLQAPHLVTLRQAGSPFYPLCIKKGGTSLNGVSHRHTVSLGQQVAREIGNMV